MKRIALGALLGALLIALGVGAAAAAIGSVATGTVSACATAVTPPHTVGVDGTPVSTVPGNTQVACTTVTYTVPTVTTTVIGTTTTSTTSTTTTTPSPSPCPPGVSCAGLLFGDEFNGPAGSLPSSTLWDAKSGCCGTGIDNVAGWKEISEDGQGDVSLSAVWNAATGRWDDAFLSGKIGYSGARFYDARIKIACGAGTWSSAWEWGYPYGRNPAFENDVIEQIGKDPQTQYHSTLHYFDSANGNHQSGKIIKTGVALCSDFHDYGAAVYADHVDFYLDGVKTASTPASAIGLTDLTTFKDVANLSLQMGGWGGTPTAGDTTTKTELIDYLHVYALTP